MDARRRKQEHEHALERKLMWLKIALRKARRRRPPGFGSSIVADAGQLPPLFGAATWWRGYLMGLRHDQVHAAADVDENPARN
jgi:hypothetical protein